MPIEELNQLIDACDEYITLGQGGRARLKEIIDGDPLSNHPDMLLRAISRWIQQVAVLLEDPSVAVDLVYEIEMYLFGEDRDE